MGKKKAANSNPIDGMHDGGTMGFLLGDEYKFCLSRLKHLKIKIDSNDLEDKTYQMFAGGVLDSYVVWGTNEFNNIRNVKFGFKGEKLNSISINVDCSQSSIEEMYDVMLSRLSRILRRKPNISTHDFSKWFSKKGAISLMILKDSFNKTGGKKIVVYVLQH